MSTHKSIKDPFWIPLILLLHLVALLLPASAATASAQANSCSAKAVQAADAPAMVIHSPDEKVEISEETIDGVVYKHYWRSRTNLQMEVYGEMMDVILRYSDMQEGSDKFIDYINKVEYQLEFNLFADESSVVSVMLNTALDTPGMAKHVPGILGKLTTYEGGILDQRDLAIGMAAREYKLAAGLSQLAEEALIELHDCAQENIVVANVVDTVHSKMKGGNTTSIRDDAKTILEKNPDLPLPAVIRQQIIENGKVELSLNELKELSKQELANINSTLDEMQTTIKDIDERQKVIVDYLSNQAEKERMQEIAKQKAARYQLKLEAAQAGISILTTVANEIDPKYAKDFSVVANSSLKIGLAINGWLKATAGLGTADKIFSLSSVVMTGNVLAAVMNIVSLFGEDQPTPEQMILDEIGKLREQVQQLRVEMHDRFDRIDKNLNSIYTTMNERFNQIDVQLGKLNGNVQEVQQSLAELDLKLSRIERNNFEFLNALGRRPLLEAINGGLDYQARTGQPMPYQPDFVNFENTLHSWATIHAFDPLNAGPIQRDFSDAQMLSELSAYPLDSNINYINGWLIAHGIPGIANKRLPSPRDWLLASRAYTRLALEWPEHMDRIDPKRGEALRQIGLELEAAMRNLSALTVVSNVVSNGVTNTVSNELLFSTVITNYQDKLDTFSLGIQVVEREFVNEVSVGQLNRNVPFDAHGGAMQSIAYRAPGIVNADCGNPENYSYELPPQIADRVTNFNLFNLADYFKVGKLNVCVTDRWANVATECVNNECYPAGDHKVQLQVYFEGVLLFQQSHASLVRQRVPASGTWIEQHYTALDYKKRFANSTSFDPLSASQEALVQQHIAKVGKQVDERLYAYQHELYRRILNEMNNGSLKGITSEVSGSKSLIDTVASLGMPRATTNDEFLHAMLYGNQQLMDAQPLVQDYVAKLAQPLEKTSLTVNPRLLLETTATERRKVFQEMINQYLDAISEELHAEEADYLASTRQMLDLTLRIVEMESGTPSVNTKQVFLPLVQR